MKPNQNVAYLTKKGCADVSKPYFMSGCQSNSVLSLLALTNWCPKSYPMSTNLIFMFLWIKCIPAIFVEHIFGQMPLSLFRDVQVDIGLPNGFRFSITSLWGLPWPFVSCCILHFLDMCLGFSWHASILDCNVLIVWKWWKQKPIILSKIGKTHFTFVIALFLLLPFRLFRFTAFGLHITKGFQLQKATLHSYYKRHRIPSAKS